MIFTERIEKLLGANNIKAVIEEFLKFLNEVPQSNRDARSDANQLRGQIIVLSGRFTELNTKINTNIIDFDDANQEKASLINSFIQIMNQLPSSYPDLNNYLEEKNEDDEWNDAQKKNTIDAYQIYFNKYPNGKYKADTIKLIAELEEVKQKQDNEIKRLALLEKERRENDKLANEPPKMHTGTTSQPVYQSSANEGSSSFFKSKKGLLIGIGIVVVAAVAIFLVVGKKGGTKEDNMQTQATTPSDPYNIDPKNYYYIQNRLNNKFLAVKDSSIEDDADIALYDESYTKDKDNAMFNLIPSGNSDEFIVKVKHTGKVILLYNEGALGQKTFEENNNNQVFKFTPKSDGYFNLTIQEEDTTRVWGFNSAEFKKEGAVISAMDLDINYQEMQWKLILTGKKVN